LQQQKHKDDYGKIPAAEWLAAKPSVDKEVALSEMLREQFITVRCLPAEFGDPAKFLVHYEAECTAKDCDFNFEYCYEELLFPDTTKGKK
jgi:hypothetical protein